MKNSVRLNREKKGITQKELGNIVGVSRQAIIAIETGKFTPSLWLAYKLANYFDLTIESLFIFEEVQ